MTQRAPRRKRRLIFVLGGASSGKSDAALAMAARGAGRGSRAFVATGEPLDAEMAQKITRHRADRGPEWETHEIPGDLAAWFEKHGHRFRVIVLDCLTLWLCNLRERGASEPGVLDSVSGLLRVIRQVPARTVVVSNELGLGLVPAVPASRAFRDLAGRANQIVAAEADEVYLVVAGIVMRIKG